MINLVKKTFAFISDFEWWIIIFFVFMTWVFGAYAFYEYSLLNSQNLNFSSLLYLSIQLFTLESGFVEGRIPLSLEIARWASPTIAVITAIKAFFVVTKENLSYLKLLFYKEHIIICGLGLKGERLCNDLLRINKLRKNKQRYKIVVVESNPNNDEISALIEQGVIVLKGSASDPVVLRRAGIKKAWYLVSFTGETKQNIEITNEAYKITKDDGEKHRLISIVSVPDSSKKKIIYQNNLFLKNTDRFSTRIYNIYEQCAREILNKFAPDKYSPVFLDSNASPQICIIGFSSLAQEILLQSARIGHYIGGKKLNVTVVAENDVVHNSLFNEKYPYIDDLININYIEQNLSYITQDFINNNSLSDVSVVYSCTDNDYSTLEASAQFRQAIQNDDIDIVSCVENFYGIDLLVSDVSEEGIGYINNNKNMFLYDVIGNTADENSVICVELDKFAIQIHNHYRNKYPESNIGDWYTIPWDSRDSNRHQADHIPVKIRALGFDYDDIYKTKSTITFSDEQLESLAKAEHDRWVAEKLIAGWRYSEKRNNERKLHNNIVSWDELTDKEKEQDKDTIRNINQLIRTVK